LLEKTYIDRRERVVQGEVSFAREHRAVRNSPSVESRGAVLAQEFGLIGRLTRDHRLGTVAHSSGPVRLADEIERMVVCGPRTFIDLSSTTTFVSSRTPKRFASTVLSSGIGAAA
jgi:hypothetical protein